MKLPFPISLVDKYQPKSLDDCIGLMKPIRVIEAFLERPFRAAFYFLGPSGVGKTAVAQIICNTLPAEEHHISSKSCDLDTLRETIDMCHRMPWIMFGPNAGKKTNWHAVHISEADQMTMAAQLDLLSRMDSTEWPPNTIFLFTANSRKGMEDRFLSRCKVLDFTADSMEGELASHLRLIYKKEGGKHPLDFEAIAKHAKYNVRDAINKLETELMIGNDRKDMPEETMAIVESHTHSCKKCHKTFKHQDALCELPYRTVCPECGGATSIGTYRAQKAWVTIRAKIANQVKEEMKKKKKGAA
jgi:replication-associated recombination protein RarA